MSPHSDAQYIPYSSTNRFSQIVLDYIAGAGALQSFAGHPATFEGIREAIGDKKKKPVNRQLLCTELAKQYEGLKDCEAVMANIGRLADENTFTICTAHQPNLFTGHLYFIYKIIHAIKLANQLTEDIPGSRFVPVFFMGSEDADLDELNHIWQDGKKYEWQTHQKGAVGRMTVDDELIKLIPALEGRLLAEPFGIEIVTLLNACYTKGRTVADATFLFVHELFKQFGLIVLLADSSAFKREMISVFKDDIFRNMPAALVNETSKRLSGHYHAQAFARDINLFYMKGDVRNRLVKVNQNFVVHDTDIVFSAEELMQELNNHPENFSPNVILRGLFQETILPDVAFIGGGGELAYWLQLKDLFEHYQRPFPVLVLRNSFLLIESRWDELRRKLGLTYDELFGAQDQIFSKLVRRGKEDLLSLENERARVREIYDEIASRAVQIDSTLIDHIEALRRRHLKQLEVAEKKFISAEKKKQEATGRQLHKLLSALFPEKGLQERTDNFMLFYAQWGKDLFEQIYDKSPVIEARFTVLTEVAE